MVDLFSARRVRRISINLLKERFSPAKYRKGGLLRWRPVLWNLSWGQRGSFLLKVWRDLFLMGEAIVLSY